MGAVLKLPPVEQTIVEQPPKLLTLRKRSRILAAIFSGLFWACAAFDLWAAWMALFYSGHHVAFGPEGGLMNTKAIETLPPGYMYWDDNVALSYRLGGVFALVTQFVPATMILFHLGGLFRLYAKGIVFAEENAKAFKLMAIWLIAYALAPFLSVHVLMLLDLAIDKAWYHNTELYALGLGCTLFVIAEVMRTAREIEQERDEFV